MAYCIDIKKFLSEFHVVLCTSPNTPLSVYILCTKRHFQGIGKLQLVQWNKNFFFKSYEGAFRLKVATKPD